MNAWQQSLPEYGCVTEFIGLRVRIGNMTLQPGQLTSVP